LNGIRSLTNFVAFRYSIEDEEEDRTKVKTGEGELRDRVGAKVWDIFLTAPTPTTNRFIDVTGEKWPARTIRIARFADHDQHVSAMKRRRKNQWNGASERNRVSQDEQGIRQAMNCEFWNRIECKSLRLDPFVTATVAVLTHRLSRLFSVV
jgi:hypothetical protein